MAFTSAKICSLCPEKGEQPIENFGLDKRRKDGRRPDCRSCRSVVSKREWENLPEGVRAGRIARTLERKRERQMIVLRAFESGCVDCGNLDVRVLEFDHLGDKEANVAYLVHSGTVEKLLAELEKCDVVCANCHKIRTYDRAPCYRTVMN